MKKIVLSVILFTAFSGFCEALLPPFYTTVAEYKALLEDKQLEEKLGSGQAIMAIKRMDNGFLVYTPKYTMRVDIVYEPTQMMGPGKFHLVFHDPEVD